MKKIWNWFKLPFKKQEVVNFDRVNSEDYFTEWDEIMKANLKHNEMINQKTDWKSMPQKMADAKDLVEKARKSNIEKGKLKFKTQKSDDSIHQAAIDNFDWSGNDFQVPTHNTDPISFGGGSFSGSGAGSDYDVDRKSNNDRKDDDSNNTTLNDD